MRKNNFIACNTKNDHIYGIFLKNVQSIISSGKICVLHSTINALKVFQGHTELIPFVVFIDTPEQSKNITVLNSKSDELNDVNI